MPAPTIKCIRDGHWSPLNPLFMLYIAYHTFYNWYFIFPNMLYILCFIFQMGTAFTMKCIRQWRRMIFTQYTYPPVTISQIPLSTLKGFILQLFSTRWNSNFSQINIFKFSDFEMSFLNFLLEQQQRSDHWPVEISITKSKKTYPISILMATKLH